MNGPEPDSICQKGPQMIVPHWTDGTKSEKNTLERKIFTQNTYSIIILQSSP